MKQITRTEFNDLKKDLNKTKKEVSTLKKILSKTTEMVLSIKEFIEKHGVAGKGILITCFKCNHPWLYKGKLDLATCTNCGAKNEVLQK